MEDDDEFGDLYTDVLRPLATSFQSQLGEADASTSHPSRPIDTGVNSDDEQIPFEAADLKNSMSNSGSTVSDFRLSTSMQEKTLSESRDCPELGGFDLNLDSSANSKALRTVGGDDSELEAMVLEKGDCVKFLDNPSLGRLNSMEDEDDGLNIVVEEREIKDDDFVEKDVNCIDKQENIYNSEQNKNADNYLGQGELGSEQMIPGLSGKFENNRDSNFENEWEDSYESEDDLQIVLNDNNDGPMGMERMPGMDDENDEDGEQLIIGNGKVGPHHQQQPIVDEQEWEGEEVTPGADGERKELGDAVKASGVQPKIGYSNHLYHHYPFHSQFKYVRPGAAPLPGAVPVPAGGFQGQVRPPITVGPGTGRGTGDWRPRGPVPMQKGLHPGYGMPVWGPNAAGRGYGSGLDFTLPSHKNWTIFEVDIDGFEGKTWRLPGIDISDFFNFGLNEESWKEYCKQLEQLRLETTMQSKIRVYESGRMEQDSDPDLPPELAAAVGNQEIPSENANAGKAEAGPSVLARESLQVSPPVPIGRAIPVETGSGDRLPSIDTRRPRIHDSDAIIEIVCQSSNDDVAEQQDNGDDVDDLQQDDIEHIDRFSHVCNGQKREIHDIGREGDLYEERQRCILKNVSNDDRSTKERGQMKSSKINASDNDGEEQVINNQDESSKGEDSKQNQPSPSSHATESDGKQAVAVWDDVNDDSVMDDRSFDTEREEMDVDVTTSDPLKERKLRCPTNKLIEGSRVEQLPQENSSENGKARSRSNKDHPKLSGSFEDEVMQDRHHPFSGRKSHGRDETGRHHILERGREDLDLQKRGARHTKIENADWRKMTKVEDTRKREHGGETVSRDQGKVRESERSDRDEHHYSSRSQMDNNGGRIGPNHDQDNTKNRTEKVDIYKRRKGGSYTSQEHAEKEEMVYNHNRESSSRRRRERYDTLAKLKDDDRHYARQKEEKRRDRDEWHRVKQSHEDILSRREREEARPPVMRSARPSDERKWIDHSRGKDEKYKGSGREHRSKDMGRQIDQLKKIDRVKDANARGNQSSNDEKKTTYERPGTSDERDVYSSDTSRLHEHRQEGIRKGKEYESGVLIPSKGNQDERSGHISETANSGGRTKQANVENDVLADRRSSRKYGEEAFSDDEQPSDSRRGRSKMECWTSIHQESDFNITSISSASSLKKSKDFPDTHNSSIASLPSKKVEPSVDEKDASGETNNASAKAVDVKHMDTVERLKKRSERFKLPMPSGKEALAIKKIESEPLPSVQTENRPDLEIKPKRPPRKRRWTGT
ncbi:hypothetical protein OROGR_013707 [Orobanche gracilis]